MRVSIIAAIDEARGIGKDNKLPWDIPADLKRFKQLTTGHPIIMGRKTFQSIGRPLPDRTNIVVTRNPDFTADGVTVVHSIDEAVDAARQTEIDEIFIIGGADIYAQALPRTDVLHLTLVAGEHDADVHFPPYEAEFSQESRETHQTDGHVYSFARYVRKVDQAPTRP